MLKYFNCPDGVKRPIKDCFDHCPNKDGRCLSLPTLYEIGNARPFTGTFSTTQLIKGIRQVYLELTNDYAINPMDTAFMLLGTRHHQKLEYSAKLHGMVSEKQLGSEISGIIDLLEPDELNPNYYKLLDYKTAGSYAVAKALGRKSDDGVADMREWELQLNKYRIELELLGIPISRMIIQSCVRDGGTFSARNNGVPEKFVMIPVKKLDDIEVFYYFKDKADALIKALETQTMPEEMCNWEERWGNRRCTKDYCSVYEWCPEGKQMNKGKR
jgi:hypothetical protein